MKPKVVISGVNLVDFGPLAVFRDSLKVLQTQISSRYEVVALVHNKNLINVDGVTYIEYPKVKSSWLRRIYFEYFESKQLSDVLKPDVWIAMHDITPRVNCERQFVYCHNPAPFYKITLREAFLDPRFAAFTLLYHFLYGVGINKNEAVIVQQEWIRKEFERRYKCRKVIVANATVKDEGILVQKDVTAAKKTFTFFFPAFSRIFKNHILLLQAVDLLEGRGVERFEVILTVDSKSNRYGRRLYRSFHRLRSVRWLGSLSRECVDGLYSQSDCLVFPSKLETWGLPISEFKATGKPILAADLPYAYETVGTYKQIRYFDTDDARNLADMMEAALLGTLMWNEQIEQPSSEPFAANWSVLWELLLGKSKHDKVVLVREGE